MLAHPRNLATCSTTGWISAYAGELSACLRSFPFRKELGRPSLLRSADVTSKAKGWSSLPMLWFGGEVKLVLLAGGNGEDNRFWLWIGL